MEEQLSELVSRFPILNPLVPKIGKAAKALILCFESGGKLLICGNGGSCSDADHIVGELMKGFCKKRSVNQAFKNELEKLGGETGVYLASKLQMALPAISLTSHTALITAVANDTDGALIYAQQVMGYGIKGDILLAISTSGNSQNIVDAIIVAKAKGMIIIGLTGESGGKMKLLCDILINVPANLTPHIQELHLPVYHTLCSILEDYFFET